MKRTLDKYILATLIAVTPAALADDAATDFAHANPNGNWSYGFEVSGTFTALSLQQQVNVSPSVWFHQGNLAGATTLKEPTVGKNEGGTTWTHGPSTQYPAGALGLHPGAGGQRAVLRWTAPSAGNYLIEATFKGGDPSTSSDARIVAAGTQIFTAAISGNSTVSSHSSVRALSAGQTVDISAGFGSNGNFSFDTTLTTATITPAAVYDAAADFSHSNPNGVWSYHYLTGSTYTLITTSQQVNANPLVWFHKGIPGMGLGEPTVGKNEGATTWTYFTTQYAAGDLALHPGPSGQRAVVRWTAPRAGHFQINAAFGKGDPSTTSDWAVTHNGTTLTGGSGATPGSISPDVTVSLGDTIEFTVGRGSNGTYYYDTTITDAIITQIP